VKFYQLIIFLASNQVFKNNLMHLVLGAFPGKMRWIPVCFRVYIKFLLVS